MVNPNMEWPEWEDKLGNKYKPGDKVAYATLWGKAAYLSFGKIVKINKCNSKGEPHEIVSLDNGDPNAHERVREVSRQRPTWGSPEYASWKQEYDDVEAYWQSTRIRTVTPTATVSILADGAAKPSNIKNLHNIIKLP